MNRAARGEDPDSVADRGLCIGCGVCALAFPGRVQMVQTAEGFNEAKSIGAPLNSDERARFERICPGLGYRVPSPLPRNHGVGDPIWGNVAQAREAWAVDEQTRELGSSGGALTALAAFLLATNYADAVVSVRAGQDPFSNISDIARSPQDCHQFSGSRYSPVTPFAAAVELEAGERIAVIGKPCDIAGLRAFVREAGTAGPNVVAYLSFFCGGTPSWNATAKAVEATGVDPKEASTIRYRGNGWPGEFTVTTADGATGSMSYNESWGTILNQQLHRRCKLCLDGIGSEADIVAADSWDSDDRGYPVFTEGAGRSFIITRTPRGEEILREAIAGGYLVGRTTDIRKLDNIQPSQRLRRTMGYARILGYRLGGNKVPRFAGIPMLRWLVKRPVAAARQAVGAYRRSRREREA